MTCPDFGVDHLYPLCQCLTVRDRDQQAVMGSPGDWFGLSREESGFADGRRGMSKKIESVSVQCSEYFKTVVASCVGSL